jgi:hypothetical protein
MFFSTGECEALYHDNVKVYKEFSAVKGNKTELQVAAQAVHDISMCKFLYHLSWERILTFVESPLTSWLEVLVGKVVGFEKEAALAAKQAGEFLKRCRDIWLTSASIMSVYCLG